MAQIDRIFQMVIQKGASDLHLSPGSPALFRVYGELVTASDTPLPGGIIEALIAEILTPEQQQEFAAENDLDFAYPCPALEARFRGNLLRTRLGIRAVFRHIPTQIPDIKSLGVPDAVLKLVHLKKGLVLVTGSTGSGKSTTLAALVDHINETRAEHILTIEDPIEFVHTNKKGLITQREVGAHTKSFARALRGSLREDPDVILLGEIRDLETMELAMTAAETGHLVLGTMHTSSASQTVERIINVFPPTQQAQIRVMLSESLKGVITQSLLKSLQGGRVAAHEILVATSSISAMIRDGKTFQIPGTMQTSRKEGMQTMDHAVKMLFDNKRVSAEEAARYLSGQNDMTAGMPMPARAA